MMENLRAEEEEEGESEDEKMRKKIGRNFFHIFISHLSSLLITNTSSFSSSAR